MKDMDEIQRELNPVERAIAFMADAIEEGWGFDASFATEIIKIADSGDTEPLTACDHCGRVLVAAAHWLRLGVDEESWRCSCKDEESEL
jgi:hypothetical protein